MASLLTTVGRAARLVGRLLLDRRVPLKPKLIPMAALVYLVSPIDLVPDLLPLLGQADDLTFLGLALLLFLRACPPHVIRQHTENLRAKVVDGKYRVVKPSHEP